MCNTEVILNWIHSLANPICVFNQKKEVIFCNDAFAKIFEGEPSALTGKPPGAIFAEKDCGFFIEAIEKANTEKNPVEKEYGFRDNNGAARIFLCNFAPIKDMETEKQVILNMFDLTEQKHEHHEQIEKEKHSERSARLNSIGTLAGGIAIELNQPVSLIKSELDAYFRKKDNIIELSEEEISESFYSISNQVDKIHSILNHMKALMVSNKGMKEVRVSLNDVLRKSVGFLSKQIESRGIKLTLQLDESCPNLLLNQIGMEQVIVNLIVNAVQALEIVERENKEIVLSTLPGEKKIILCITDNGSGIEEKYLKKVFDPFFTTRKSKNALGLGLSIAENFVRSMGGKISVKNNEDNGSSFELLIPVR